jgi:hypothetical protein
MRADFIASAAAAAVMVVVVEYLELFSFFHNKTHIESHVQVH